MKRNVSLFVGTLAALLLTACGSSQSTAETTTPVEMSQPAQSAGCPLIADTTSVVAEDTDTGAAIIFTTVSGDPEVLQEHAEHLAEMHEEHRGEGTFATEFPVLSAASADVEDLDAGARIVFEPAEEGDLEALRAEARTRADMIASGQCPMRSYH